MYGCEAWKLTKTEGKKLDGFKYKCMKMIQRIKVVSDHFPLTNPGEHRSEQNEQ